MRLYQHSGGYSILELLLAMAVFSFLLLMVVQGFTSITHSQENQQVSREVQRNTAAAMRELVNRAQLSYAATVYPDPTTTTNLDTYKICLWGSGQVYAYDVKPDGTLERYYGLIATDPTVTSDPNQTVLQTACQNAAPLSISSGSFIIGPSTLTSNSVQVKLLQAKITRTTVNLPNGQPVNRQTIQFTVEVASKVAPPISAGGGTTYNCDLTKPNNQFCSTYSLTSTAELRGVPR